MELEAPLIFLRNRADDGKFALCSTADARNQNLNVKTSDKLRGRELDAYFYGWFVLKDQKFQYSLWNPLTLEFISLPRLDLRPEQEVNYCVITSPPTESNSKFLLFEKNGNSLFCCKIGDDEQWTHYHIKDNYEDDNLDGTVICNGMIFGYLFKVRKLIKIDLTTVPDRVDIVVFDKSIPDDRNRPYAYYEFLIEYCNQLFLIRLYMEVPKLKVIDVQVLVLDFSDMEWKKVKRFEDKAFFITLNVSSFCCPVIGEEIKGNHVYFTSPEENYIYSINIDDKTIAVFSSFTDSSSVDSTYYQPIWITTSSRSLDQSGRKKRKLDFLNYLDGAEKRRKLDKREIVGDMNFKKLFSDMLFEIGKRIIFGDYISFRAVNKLCRISCPPIQWSSAKLEEFNDYNYAIPPWLTYWKKGDSICNCFDLQRSELYFMNLPNNDDKDIMVCHSKFGWCIMLQEEKVIWLWNPLTKETISLPNLAYDCECVTACTLSSTKDLVFVLYNDFETSVMQLMFLKEGEWLSEEYDMTDFKGRVEIDANIVYYDEHLYIFDMEGTLTIFKTLRGGGEVDWNFQVIHQLASPSSFDKCFLIECSGKIVSVFVGLEGEGIRTFSLDFINKVWVEVEDFGDKTLYISRFSCLSGKPPILGMENRIYFGRYHEKNNNVIYYSPKSKKLHAHGSEQVVKSFSQTREQLYSCWVEVMNTF